MHTFTSTPMFIPNVTDPDMNLFGTFRDAFRDVMMSIRIDATSIDRSFPAGTPIKDVCVSIIKHLNDVKHPGFDMFAQRCLELGVFQRWELGLS